MYILLYSFISSFNVLEIRTRPFDPFQRLIIDIDEER